jgi:hypothetical protein
MSIYLGTPSVRIWVVGTRRIIGVSEAGPAISDVSADDKSAPLWILGDIDTQTYYFGYYTVCPYNQDQPGRMRLVCIESGKIIAQRKM